MAHPLFVNSLVNLIIGAALVMAWRRHREQLFLRALGLATLLQVLTPPAYLWWQHADGLAALPAALLMVASSAGHVLLVADGALGLAGRAPTRRRLAWCWPWPTAPRSRCRRAGARRFPPPST